MTDPADFIVIGAGIAGLSAAAELAATAAVVVLEREDQPGFHATGRSAAFFAPTYGNETVRAISSACETFFRSPPAGFTEAVLLRPRDALFIARADQQLAIAGLRAVVENLTPVGAREICSRVPILDSSYVADGLVDSTGGDLDVDALLQGYRRRLKQRRGRLHTAVSISAINFRHGLWSVSTQRETYTAPTLINAAGAWADPIAQQAGLRGIGIQPRRRTALLIDVPGSPAMADWPMVIDADETFYFKPEAGQLLVSPADATESDPCDAQPEEIDVAIAVDRLTRATGLQIQRINHRWAGLRSFAKDDTFVVGIDPRQPSFFWLAGQGGYGVQSAPALAELTSHLLTGNTLAPAYARLEHLKDAVAPERLIRL